MKDAKRRRVEQVNPDVEKKRFVVILCTVSFSDLLPSVDLIDLTSSDAGKPIKYWMKDLQLYEADKESLDQGKWLTDNIINAAQVLLKKIHPHIGGLESVAL